MLYYSYEWDMAGSSGSLEGLQYFMKLHSGCDVAYSTSIHEANNNPHKMNNMCSEAHRTMLKREGGDTTFPPTLNMEANACIFSQTRFPVAH